MTSQRGTLFRPTFAFPMMSVCVLVGAFLVYYFPVTSRQGATLDRRAFRSLAAVADSVAARIANYTEVLHQGAKRGHGPARPSNPGGLARAEFTVGPVTGTAPAEASGDDCRGGPVTVTTEPHNGEHALVLTCGSWIGTVAIGALMGPYLDDTVEQLFDEVLLASADGVVVHQTSRTGGRMTSLASVAMRTASAPADEAGETATARTGAPTFATAGQSSTLLTADIAGEEYRVYLVPVSLKRSRSASAATSDLVLVGLTTSRRFRTASMALPGTALVSAILLVLIAVAAAWPLLKFATMGATERLPRRSAAYLFLSTLATIVLVAMLAIHLRYTVNRAGVDDALQRLADRIEGNLAGELQAALRVLDSAADSELLARALPPAPAEQCASQLSTADTLAHRVENLLTVPGIRLSDYPYFDRIFWSDSRGYQHVKWEAGRPTSATFVGDRVYFVATTANRLWRLAGSPPTARRFRVDSVLSRNTGEYRAIISQPAPRLALCPGVELSVVSMVTPLLSIIDPILPPDYGFAIVDPDGSVLFHSTRARNLAERLLDEVDDRDAVQAALFARRGMHLTTRYGGVDHRLFVTPVTALEGSPWSLVVFHNLSDGATEHLERIVLFALLAFACFTTVAGVVLTLPASRRIPQWLWPSEELRGTYLHLTLTIAALAALLYPLLFALSAPAAVLLVAWLVPPLVLGIIRLTVAPVHRMVSRTLFVLLAAILIAIVWYEPQTKGSLSAGVVGVLSVLVVLSVRPISTWLLTLWPASLTSAYTSMWAAAVAVSALLPCFAFFRVAYDYHGNVATRRQQVRTIAALEEREARARQLYGQRTLTTSDDTRDVARWLFLRRRLAETTDRYDVVVRTPGSGQLVSPETARVDADGCDDGLPTYLQAAAAVDPYADRAQTRALTAPVAARHSAWSWCREGINRLRISGGTIAPAHREALSLPPALALFKYVTRDPMFLNAELVTELPLLAPWPLAATMLTLFATGLICFAFMRPTLRQLFLLDVAPAAPFTEVALEGTTPFADHTVLLTLDRTAAIAVLRARPDVRILDCASLPDGPEGACDVGSEPVVVLDHFDYRLDDAAANAKKLRVLERLVSPASSKRVVVLSTVDPVFFFGPDSDLSERPSLEALAPGRDLERWSTVLASFRRVRVTLTSERPPHECGRSVWATCTTAERVSLYQLAHDGWVNPRNEAALHELEQRGLIAGRPYRFTGTALEAFVAQRISPEDRRSWQRQDASHVWEGIRLMFVVLIFAVLAVALFFSQQSTLGVIATGLGVLTPLARLLSEANSVRSLLGFGKGSE